VHKAKFLQSPKGQLSDQCNGFEGLTPKAMHELLYAPYDETKSPMVLNRNIDTQSINQVRFYNDIILYKVT